MDLDLSPTAHEEATETPGDASQGAFGTQIEASPPPQPMNEGKSWSRGTSFYAVAMDLDLLALINGQPSHSQPSHRPQPLQQGQQASLPAPAPITRVASSLDPNLSLFRSLPSAPCIFTSQPRQGSSPSFPLARLLPQCLQSLAGKLNCIRVLYVPSLSDQQRMEQGPGHASDE